MLPLSWVYALVITPYALMAPLTDPSASSPDDELESFPQRTITSRRSQQNQRVRRIMAAKDNTLNPILTPSALDKLKKFHTAVGTWAVCSDSVRLA